MKSAFISLLATAAPAVHAWGAVGHETVAYVATNFVSSATKSYCQNILGDTSTSYLANVATWADTYRYTDAGAFSAPYHFIDAQDNPPSSCGADYDRDCGETGCVVRAIQNYTNTLTATQDLDSLKFIIHFIGDCHQPLHDEALDVGGNDISVTFAGAQTNLHHIWDTDMITKLTGGTSLSDAKALATTLTNSIKTGAYKSQASSWLSGIDVNDPITTSMTWVSQANAYVCNQVLGQGVKSVESEDLSGDYYTAAVPVIEIQLARAGYRLAAWLNLIVTGETGL